MAGSDVDLLPPPTVFGFPDKFSTWRPNQVSAISMITNDQLAHRFIGVVAPTGYGKSIMYVAAAVLAGWRTLFLTSSKGLQSQLLSDFGGMGMVDMRGRGNYRCRLAGDGSTCDHGPCVAGVKCDYKENGGCNYQIALSEAAGADLVVTNYAYWMASNEYAGGPLGKFDLLVCDEGHELPNLASDWMTVVIEKSDRGVGMVAPDWSVVSRYQLHHWREWARSVMGRVDKEAESMSTHLKSGGGDRWLRRDFVRMRALHRSLLTIATMDDDWVVDAGEREVSFSPIFPAPYMEKVMWRGVPRVLITSATLCPKTMDMIGVGTNMGGDPLLYREYPHSFPVRNRTLLHIPTVQLNHRNENNPDYMRSWLSRIDQIVGGRLDRKGIIHTTSYKRRDMVMASSHYREYFITHKRLDTESQVEAFKRAPPPRVLISPSMATGWDFPNDQARYQIIGKLSYPDTRNRIVKARCDVDPDYGAYIAMQQLVQAVGRAVRGPEDWAESFIIDDNVVWFMRKYGGKGGFAPQWFREAYGRSEVVPRAREMR